jgi:hypothetical protein
MYSPQFYEMLVPVTMAERTAEAERNRLLAGEFEAPSTSRTSPEKRVRVWLARLVGTRVGRIRATTVWATKS